MLSNSPTTQLPISSPYFKVCFPIILFHRFILNITQRASYLHNPHYSFIDDSPIHNPSTISPTLLLQESSSLHLHSMYYDIYSIQWKYHYDKEQHENHHNWHNIWFSHISYYFVRMALHEVLDKNNSIWSTTTKEIILLCYFKEWFIKLRIGVDYRGYNIFCKRRLWNLDINTRGKSY